MTGGGEAGRHRGGKDGGKRWSWGDPSVPASMGRETLDGRTETVRDGKAASTPGGAREHGLEDKKGAARTQGSGDDARPGSHRQAGRGWTESESSADDKGGECL